MRLIFRMEDDRGEGPYRGKHTPIPMMYSVGTSWHPTPSNDGVDEDLRDSFKSALHGFSSIEKLNDWFGEFFKYMLGHFYVTVYAVPDDCVAEGKKQVVFDGGSSEPLWRFPLHMATFDGDGNIDQLLKIEGVFWWTKKLSKRGTMLKKSIKDRHTRGQDRTLTDMFNMCMHELEPC